MLTTFEPGTESISWASKFGMPKTLNDLPVAPTLKKPSNYVVWLQPSAIQNDVQVRRLNRFWFNFKLNFTLFNKKKIIRYTRKLPDKFDALHNEVVRFKRTAIAYYLFDLIDTMIILLQRESTNHPEVATEIGRIINLLNKPYDDNTC